MHKSGGSKTVKSLEVKANGLHEGAEWILCDTTVAYALVLL